MGLQPPISTQLSSTADWLIEVPSKARHQSEGSVCVCVCVCACMLGVQWSDLCSGFPPSLCVCVSVSPSLTLLLSLSLFLSLSFSLSSSRVFVSVCS